MLNRWQSRKVKQAQAFALGISLLFNWSPTQWYGVSVSVTTCVLASIKVNASDRQGLLNGPDQTGGAIGALVCGPVQELFG
jgi:hypothetical protein